MFSREQARKRGEDGRHPGRRPDECALQPGARRPGIRRGAAGGGTDSATPRLPLSQDSAHGTRAGRSDPGQCTGLGRTGPVVTTQGGDPGAVACYSHGPRRLRRAHVHVGSAKRGFVGWLPPRDTYHNFGHPKAGGVPPARSSGSPHRPPPSPTLGAGSVRSVFKAVRCDLFLAGQRAVPKPCKACRARVAHL